MKKLHVVNEFELLRFARCPLYLARTENDREREASAALNRAAEDLLTWIARVAWEGAIPELPVIRERAEGYFRKRFGGTMTLAVAKRLLRISRRLHELVLFNDILQPQGL